MALVFAACGPTGTNGNSGGSSGSTGSGGVGGYGGGTGGSGTGGSGGSIDPNQDALNCGVQNFMLQKGLPPDLLIVLDQSSSMSDPPGSGGASKWSQVTGAITSTVNNLQNSIKFGLEYFPTDGSCGVASVDVPVAAMNAGAIQTSINAHSPNGSTPTADGIHTAQTYLTGLNDQNPKYILLATDGDPTCPAGGNLFGDPVADAYTAVSNAAQAGVHTFVIGVATDSTSDGILNMLAQNGMEARPGGPPYYYQVSNQQDLVNVINSIAGQIVSCNLPLQMAPQNPDYVHIIMNGMMVPRDTTHMNGWDFGPGNMSIQFYGSYCMQLQNSANPQVQAVFDCPPIGIHR